LSTSLATPHKQLGKRNYRTNWKNRGSYGLVLKRKLEHLMVLFEEEANKNPIDFDMKNIIDLSRSIDFNVSVQLTNIKAVEDFIIMEAWERYLATTQRTPEGLRLEATAFR